MVVTTGAIGRAKLQSDHHHQQTNIQFFYRLDALPVTQPTVSKSTEGKISHSMDLLTPSSPGGLPTLSLTTNGYLVTLGEGCHASHQPSHASTLNDYYKSKTWFRPPLIEHQTPLQRSKGQGRRGRGILWRPPTHLVNRASEFTII